MNEDKFLRDFFIFIGTVFIAFITVIWSYDMLGPPDTAQAIKAGYVQKVVPTTETTTETTTTTTTTTGTTTGTTTIWVKQ